MSGTSQFLSLVKIIGNALCCAGLLVACGQGQNEEPVPPTPSSQPPSGVSALAITTNSLASGTIGQPYNAMLSGTSGTTPYAWSVSPALPTSMILDSSTGVISGTPTTSSNTAHIFTLVDASSPVQTSTKSITLTINSAPIPLSITTAALPAGTVNQVYPATTLQAAGGEPPYSWSVSPALPSWAVLNPLTGVISGTPTTGSNLSHIFMLQDVASQSVQKPLTLTISTVQPPSPRVAKIMPLGDSITESIQSMSTYRYYLWQLAAARGYRIDLVGSQRGAFQGAPLNRNFDMDHEGHWGWRADEILANISEWAASASPDFVLIHLGHNDLCQGQGISGTVAEVGTIIDRLRIANPRIGIVLAQVIGSSVACHSQIPAFNSHLPALVTAKHTQHSPVVLVDHHTNFVPATMTWDGVHPNATGESHMADRWFGTLIPLLESFFAASP